MESQTSTGPTLRGSNITLESVTKPNNVENRTTKIICTLGPACWNPDQLEGLIDAGMCVARFNFSHGDHAGHAACLERLRAAATKKNKHIAVMLDTKGPEIRSGFFKDGVKKISLVKGNKITLTTDYSYKGDNTKLACSYSALATSVTPGQTILCADGSLCLRVLSCDVTLGEVSCQIDNNTEIGERKNMNLPGVHVQLPTCTEKDIDDIQKFGCKYGVDFIAASFVRKAEDVTFIRKILAEKGGSNIKIICKIENLEGMENYQAILQETDGIMVARGDLGMEIPPEKVFLAQKMMIREANIAGKPVVTATQMFESMITNPRPTRAEASDVANAVLDGSDCVMLSGETANGEHPVAAVKIMARTCVEAESMMNCNALYEAVRNSTISRYGSLGTAESVASSAVKTCIDIQAKAIIVCSETGTTARLIAKYRPPVPICVLTPHSATARQCSGVLKGCFVEVNNIKETDCAIKETIFQMLEQGKLKKGDAFVIVHGQSANIGSTNTMKVDYC